MKPNAQGSNAPQLAPNRSIQLPAGTEFVPVDSVPRLIAGALHPPVEEASRQVSQINKFGKQNAPPEIAEWNGWPLDAEDLKKLKGLGITVPELPASEHVWNEFLREFEKKAKKLDWTIEPLWTTPELKRLIRFREALSQHRAHLYAAIESGELEQLDPTSHIPTNQLRTGGIVSVASLNQYAMRFGVVVVVSPVESIAPNPAAHESPNNDDAESDGTKDPKKQGLSKQRILSANWPKSEMLSRAMSDNTPQWLLPARVTKGAPGKASATWNPAIFAYCLHEHWGTPTSQLRSLIKDHFPDWLEEWQAILTEY